MSDFNWWASPNGSDWEPTHQVSRLEFRGGTQAALSGFNGWIQPEPYNGGGVHEEDFLLWDWENQQTIKVTLNKLQI